MCSKFFLVNFFGLEDEMLAKVERSIKSNGTSLDSEIYCSDLPPRRLLLLPPRRPDSTSSSSSEDSESDSPYKASS
ncbi:unnamed protein product [[Candida] boidinii]|nr:unnamed protein product [[Candida] boidinii]